MNDPTATTDSPLVTQRVRAAAFWSGVAAAVMLGYAYMGGGWLIPTEGVVRVGALVFIYTVEVGGWGMAAVTLCLLTGRRWALAADAAVSAIVGALFGVSGLLLLSGGGLQAMLNIIFGAMFLSAARTNWREYGQLGAAERVPLPPQPGPTARPPSEDEVPVPADSLASQLRESLAQKLEDPPEAALEPTSRPQPAAELDADAPNEPDERPHPEGYLAKLANPRHDNE